jgi:non-canonical (house-cleaning) NTP pyrophosphatase
MTQEVASGVRETPISRAEIMSGARYRVRELLRRRPDDAHAYFVGLEGGFEVVEENDRAEGRLVFLENWAYVGNGDAGYFGSGGAIAVPADIAVEVVDRGRSLAAVIDEFAGRQDIRSAEGAWGVLTGGRLSRAEVFYRALVNAFAPFYNGTADKRG